MPTADDTRAPGQGGRHGAPLALVCIGSPENGFADAGRTESLDGIRRVDVGRGAADQLAIARCDDVLAVEIPLLWVSGRHAEIALVDATPRLRDHGSRNGTRIEGRTVEGDVELRPGDTFEIGRSFWALLDAGGLDDDAALAVLEPTGTVSPRLRARLRALARVAVGGTPILVHGETGVGKDRLAHAVHALSKATGPFVHANLASGSVEQVLLGGGVDGEPSLLQRARGGTLLLDEIGELDAEEQAKLASVLLSGAGDVRLVSATTRDLHAMAAIGEFRSDLMHRIAGHEIGLVPLRERKADLGLLVRALARRDDGAPVPISTDVFRAMLAYDWPFNVRELQHSLAAAVATTPPGEAIGFERWRRVGWSDAGPLPDPVRIQAVRTALVQHLGEHGGDMRAIARAMHCEIADVERWLDRFELRPEQYGRAG